MALTGPRRRAFREVTRKLRAAGFGQVHLEDEARAVGPQDAEGVGLVENQHGAFALREERQRLKRREATVHRKDRVGHKKPSHQLAACFRPRLTREPTPEGLAFAGELNGGAVHVNVIFGSNDRTIPR